MARCARFYLTRSQPNLGVRVHPHSRFRMTGLPIRISFALFASLTLSSPARAQDAFASVKCGSDIPRALIGKKSPRVPVAATERKHRDIGLNSEGASQVSDKLFYIGWTLCGREYAFIENKNNRIRDVIPFPPHSRQSPGFFGSCTIDGKSPSDAVLAILANPAPLPADRHYAFNDSTSLNATSAWRVDEKHARFVALRNARIECPRNSIFTVDGGP